METLSKNFFACVFSSLLALRQLWNFPGACKIMWLNEVSLDCTSAHWPRAIHDSCIFVKQLHIQSDSPHPPHPQTESHYSACFALRGSSCICSTRTPAFVSFLLIFKEPPLKTQCPCRKSAGTRHCCAASYQKVCVNSLCGENAAQGGIEFLWGKFEPFIKVFEVEQKRRRRCVVPFRGHWEVVFPRACAFASRQYRQHPEWAWKAIIMSAVVVSLWGRSAKLCSSHYQRLSVFHPFLFRVSNDTQDSELATVRFCVCLVEPPSTDVHLIWLDTAVPTLAAVTWCEI